MIKTSQPKVTKLKIRQKLCETLGVKTRLCYNIGSKCLSAAKMSPVRTSCHAKDLHADPRTEHRTQNADPRTELQHFPSNVQLSPAPPLRTTVIYAENYDRKAKLL